MMTDNEIKKAFAAHFKSKREQACIECSLQDDGDCCVTLLENANNLINRQNAEIERLNRSISTSLKEFAERLKEVGTKVEGGKGFEGIFVMANNLQIDNLLAEMTEQKNEGKE